jgi:arginine exporter protein ArgO
MGGNNVGPCCTGINGEKGPHYRSDIVGVIIIAWIYLAILAENMKEMSATEEMMQIRAWTSIDFVLMFFMWAVMMVVSSPHVPYQ